MDDAPRELTRTELRRVCEEFKSERDAAKQATMRAFDERNVLLAENAALRAECDRLAERGKHYRDEMEKVSQAADDVRAECDALKERNVELSVLAYNWMCAHDALKAGKPYELPATTDLPNIRAECDALRRQRDDNARDAARYRWLRKEQHMEGRAEVLILRSGDDWGSATAVVSAAGLDDAVDEAMQEERRG